ncbi:sugar transporter ERD6-like 16 isoform X3 [Jatropha curcas]|nr:sugar transporter ERD6-like 16 isoform X3 [Jatropha curcas]
MEDLNLTASQYSMFGSILTIGAMLGAITSGRIADYIGRKGAMRMSVGFCITGWVAVFFSKEYFSLDMGRFFTGYGIGVFSFVIPIYIAEISPKNLRGGLTTLNQLMIVTGSSTAFLLGSVISWKALALTGLVPCIFLLVGLFFIPESPRWLAKVGRDREFKVALQKLRGKDADITREEDEIQDSIEILEALPKARFLDLFQRQYIRVIFIGVAIMICQQFVGINGVGFYVSQIFVTAGLSSGTLGTMNHCLCLYSGSDNNSGSNVNGQVWKKTTNNGFCSWDMVGTSFLLKSLSLLLGWVPILAAAGVLVFISAFSIGMGAVPWLIMSEIFPINIKGVGGSLVVLVNWLGAWIVSYTFNFLISWSSSGTFFLYSGFSLMTILFVAKFVPETKGKTLEEIQECINS